MQSILRSKMLQVLMIKKRWKMKKKKIDDDGDEMILEN